jgi:hypothetical protein
MDKQAFFDETPPDYVALVIEWDEIADSIEDEITDRTAVPVTPRHRLAAVLGGIAAIAFAAWGIHRLRAA